jgi:amidase
MVDVLGQSAVAQGRLIARREIASAELVDAYLARIAKWDSELNSFVQTVPRRARLASRRVSGDSPLAGVPVGIKDLNLVRGMRATFGSRAFSWVISPIDDAVARSLKRAGMVVLGKLSTSELGTMPVTEPDTHPPTRNPWDLSRTAGGSSGGSAAAVAAGLLPIAQGSDGGGSVRIPSALCGLFGVKPGRGFVTHAHPGVDFMWITVDGPLARFVDDAAAMLDALAFRPSRLLDESRGDPPRQLRVALSTNTKLGPSEPALVEAARAIAARLNAWGWPVEERPWIDVDIEDFLTLWRANAANLPLPPLGERFLQPVNQWLRREGRSVGKQTAMALKDRLMLRAGAWWGDVDLWVSPTVPITAPPIGFWQSEDPAESFRRVVPLGSFTAVFNLSGQPAINIPVGLSPQGLPLGVQIAARAGQELLLLQIARRLESELGGFSRLAPRYEVA